LNTILIYCNNGVKRDRIGNRNASDGLFSGLISDGFSQAGGSEASIDSAGN
jgi:hypothetical protein